MYQQRVSIERTIESSATASGEFVTASTRKGQQSLKKITESPSMRTISAKIDGRGHRN
jgi:hypothetical protein